MMRFYKFNAQPKVREVSVTELDVGNVDATNEIRFFKISARTKASELSVTDFAPEINVPSEQSKSRTQPSVASESTTTKSEAKLVNKPESITFATEPNPKLVTTCETTGSLRTYSKPRAYEICRTYSKVAPVVPKPLNDHDFQAQQETKYAQVPSVEMFRSFPKVVTNVAEPSEPDPNLEHLKSDASNSARTCEMVRSSTVLRTFSKAVPYVAKPRSRRECTRLQRSVQHHEGMAKISSILELKQRKRRQAWARKQRWRKRQTHKDVACRRERDRQRKALARQHDDPRNNETRRESATSENSLDKVLENFGDDIQPPLSPRDEEKFILPDETASDDCLVTTIKREPETVETSDPNLVIKEEPTSEDEYEDYNVQIKEEPQWDDQVHLVAVKTEPDVNMNVAETRIDPVQNQNPITRIDQNQNPTTPNTSKALETYSRVVPLIANSRTDVQNDTNVKLCVRCGKRQRPEHMYNVESVVADVVSNKMSTTEPQTKKIPYYKCGKLNVAVDSGSR